MSVIRYPHPKHLNGTGMVGLDSQHADVLKHLDKAIQAVRDATPHARDWQGAENSNEGYVQARQTSIYRVESLTAIRDDVYDGWLAIREENLKT